MWVPPLVWAREVARINRPHTSRLRLLTRPVFTILPLRRAPPFPALMAPSNRLAGAAAAAAAAAPPPLAISIARGRGWEGDCSARGSWRGPPSSSPLSPPGEGEREERGKRRKGGEAQRATHTQVEVVRCPLSLSALKNHLK